MRKLKAGIVGCGGIANGKHLPAMKKSGLYEIVAFCDIIRERAEKAKKEYGTESLSKRAFAGSGRRRLFRPGLLDLVRLRRTGGRRSLSHVCVPLAERSRLWCKLAV